jgi:hypothetical protein
MRSIMKGNLIKTISTRLFWLVVLLSVTDSWSQQQKSDNANGLFLTKEDFLSNKVSFLQERDSLDDLREDLNENIVLIRNGKKTIYRHDAIFGYYYNGSKYIGFGKHKNWFSDVGFYKIEDEGVLIIYSEPGYRQNADHVFYFYSRQLDSPVRRLTFRHLRSDFKENQAFIDSLRKYRHTAKDRLDMKDCLGDEKIINQLLRDFHYKSKSPDSSARYYKSLPIL